MLSERSARGLRERQSEEVNLLFHNESCHLALLIYVCLCLLNLVISTVLIKENLECCPYYSIKVDLRNQKI